MVKMIICVVAYLILAPFVGGLLAGIDRIISARMQGRKGPSVLQPFYDVLKLTEKEKITVNNVQDFYIVCFFIFILVTGCLFFAGQDLLLVIFTLSLASTFLIVGAFSSGSAYATLAAERELLQMMAYEPMVLIAAIAFYLHAGSFKVSDILVADRMGFPYMVAAFIGFVFILTIKFRKAPFDLSMSHHAHQELVGGLKTEFSGTTLALVEAAHWYENVMLLGFVFLFFTNGTVAGAVIGVVVCLATYFLEIVIGNSFARMKWPVALKSAWLVAITFGMANIVFLYFN
ncbi:MAG: NADH-quinone oxidoreductase subunit H [Firmicutes bacterium]|jgi:formate hydrogenlyase subunit 4|nr:NADH-quinone oxidoreductase subunit H [Bacillota bacterium]